MDLNYLESIILPKRKREIEQRKNLGTRQPIYVVYSLEEHASEGHSEFLGADTNHKGKNPEHGYIDRADDSPEFKSSPIGMENIEEVTRFWIDRATAFFFTSQGAHDYKKYQAHNMNEPYVFVHYSGYGNREMDAILQGG